MGTTGWLVSMVDRLDDPNATEHDKKTLERVFKCIRMIENNADKKGE